MGGGGGGLMDAIKGKAGGLKPTAKKEEEATKPAPAIAKSTPMGGSNAMLNAMSKKAAAKVEKSGSDDWDDDSPIVIKAKPHPSEAETPKAAATPTPAPAKTTAPAATTGGATAAAWNKKKTDEPVAPKEEPKKEEPAKPVANWNKKPAAKEEPKKEEPKKEEPAPAPVDPKKVASAWNKKK